MTDTPLVVGPGGKLELLATQLLTFARATATPAP